MLYKFLSLNCFKKYYSHLHNNVKAYEIHNNNELPIIKYMSLSNFIIRCLEIKIRNNVQYDIEFSNIVYLHSFNKNIFLNLIKIQHKKLINTINHIFKRPFCL